MRDGGGHTIVKVDKGARGSVVECCIVGGNRKRCVLVFVINCIKRCWLDVDCNRQRRDGVVGVTVLLPFECDEWLVNGLLIAT